MEKIRDVRPNDQHTNCEYCGEKSELRPYGKDGAWICFDCGMNPGNKKTTETMFDANLRGSDVLITGASESELNG